MNISNFVFPESSVVNTNWWYWAFLIIGWVAWIIGTILLHYVVKPSKEESDVNNQSKYVWMVHLAWVSAILIIGVVFIIMGAYSTEFGTTYAEYFDSENPNYDTLQYSIAWQLGFLIPGSLILLTSSFVTLKVAEAWGQRYEYKKIGAPYSFWSFKGFWYQTRHIIYVILTLVMIMLGWGFIVAGTGHIFGGVFVTSPV